MTSRQLSLRAALFAVGAVPAVSAPAGPDAGAEPEPPRRSLCWWRVLPLVFITYSLAYLDRAN